MCNVNCIIFGATALSKEEVEGKRVIEIGSRDIYGSIRPIIESWKPCEYVGIDIEPGPGVDIICPAEDIVTQFGKNKFDIVISTCVLEHIKDWRKAISNMKNVCKPNGIILMIVPSDWGFHAYPHDYWRYNPEDIENIFSDSDILILKEDEEKPSLVYAKIRKPDKFEERDLTSYELYSIITNIRTLTITEDCYNKFIRKYNQKQIIVRTLQQISLYNICKKLMRIGKKIIT